MEVTQRFLKYVSFDTTSSETSDTVPTTAHQRVLGQYLADELAALGLSFGVKALSVLLAVRREDRQRTGQKQNAAV